MSDTRDPYDLSSGGRIAALRAGRVTRANIGANPYTGARAVTLELYPLSLQEANAFVSTYHRHHGPVVGHKFSLGVGDGESIRGVAIVGRPVSRCLDNGATLEVTRLCTDGTKNAASKLYAAAWRATRALGYRRLITYILNDEIGTSVRAAGWRLVGEAGGGSWSCPSRPRVDNHPLQGKLRWEIACKEDEEWRAPFGLGESAR